MNGKPLWYQAALREIKVFSQNHQLGEDPFARIYEVRRKDYHLFSQQLTDEEIAGLEPYLFNYSSLPSTPADEPIACANYINGSWSQCSNAVVLKALNNRQVRLCAVPDSGEIETKAALESAEKYWKSLHWSQETLAYRKQVIKNFSRILHVYLEKCLQEIRTVIPKTRLEAEKDFWEAKRAADHLEGSAEFAMRGQLVPSMIEGHSYWKKDYLPAGIASIFTPMNFIYGIPVIQLVGAYLVGCPIIFKGHPLGAICNTTLMRMLLAAGAHPKSIQKVEGFGGKIQALVDDPRVAVVSVTGSDETAAHMQALRGLKRVQFEGGGTNWAFIDQGFTHDELKRIATRLVYSKLGFSSHKCTTLHGVAAPSVVLEQLLPLMAEEMKEWKIQDPTRAAEGETRIVGPCMVHQAQTASNIQAAAEKAGARIFKRGGKRSESEYEKNAEVIDPIILSDVTPQMVVEVDWDGKGMKKVSLMGTEFFMPILVASSMGSIEDFIHFSLFQNPHDLAVSIWSKSEENLRKARAVLGGMLKENDGTDSALEWEEFGASGVGVSGNMGVGEPEATFRIFSRKQKGRSVFFQ